IHRLALKRKSIIEYQMGDYRGLISTSRKVLAFDRANNDASSISNILSNISTGFHSLHEFDSAMYYQQLSYEMAVESGDSQLIVSQAMDFVPILVEVNEVDSAEKLLLKYLHKSKETKIDYLMYLINYGTVFNKREQYKESRVVYEE